MIGIFLKNDNGMLCLVQPPQPAREEIERFHYAKGSGLLIVHYKNGAEEAFTQEISPEMRTAFTTEKSVLVVHLDDKGKFEREYGAKLTV